MAEPGRPRPSAPVARRLNVLGTSEGRAVATALASTVVVVTLIGVAVVNSTGWPAVKQAFLNPQFFRTSFPDVARAFELNVKMFLVAEVLILAFALGVAVLRSLPGPVFFPIRALAIVYTDVFRGLPTVLVVYVLALGVPGLQLTGVPNSAEFWAVVGLVLVYSAYVAEVYRAGIESVHPSQESAARSLGLSRWQTLRHVIIPQAVRRVIPPLLNDFIGLQKDTALVAFVGPVEAFRQAQIAEAANFNFTPYMCTAVLFLALTIPLTRTTDWLIARDRAKRAASGVA